MSSEQHRWIGRNRKRSLRPEVAPESVVTAMEEATQRLRDQAWKINATTRAPLIDEASLTTESASGRDRRSGS